MNNPRVCPNCYTVADPEVTSKGSWTLCIMLWIFSIIGAVVSFPFFIFSVKMFFVICIIVFVICLIYTSYTADSDKIYSCPTCKSENPLPLTTPKGMTILNKLKESGDKKAEEAAGFINTKKE